MSNTNDDIALLPASTSFFPESKEKLISPPPFLPMEFKEPVQYRLYKQRFVGLVALV